MADFLLAHDAGHGSWCWGRVWGHLTAPVDHPPRLYAKTNADKVVAPDLYFPPPTDEEDESPPSFDDLVAQLTNEIESHGLHDLVIAAHGLAAPVVLQAAHKLSEPPKRIVLFAGVIPEEGKSTLDILPRQTRFAFKMLARLNRLARKEMRLPNAAITNVYCNGMDPFDVIQIVGRFTSLPYQLFQTKLFLRELEPPCPITYVPLWRDKLVPSVLQRRMASRLQGVEVIGELDACHEVLIERPKQVADILLRYA